MADATYQDIVKLVEQTRALPADLKEEIKRDARVMDATQLAELLGRIKRIQKKEMEAMEEPMQYTQMIVQVEKKRKRQGQKKDEAQERAATLEAAEDLIDNQL